jgi:cyclopropane fatty-acyl-phospholipid synthase-like methyltransferase
MHTQEDVERYTGSYPANGRAHVEILQAEGMNRQSRVLEIGCGCLYAGLLLMDYLEPGLYCAIDPNAWLRDTTIHNGDFQWLIDDRCPRFTSRSDFDGSEFNERFDFVFSQSVLSHASATQLGEYFRNTKRVLADDGKILTSLFLADLDSNDTEWVYPGRSYFTWATVQREAAEAGLSVCLKPEYTLTVQQNSLESGWGGEGHCHDWLLLERI